jgi:hypothetical protein
MIRYSIQCATFAACLVSAHANAELVNIAIDGTVAFSVIQGNQATVPDGAPVAMSFNVDSNVFLNSGSFPTRGYNIILSSFTMTVGGQPVPIVNPQPGGQTAYFVLRNNDPAVDGFFISTNVNVPFPVAVSIPGLAQTHDLDFSATYSSGSTLSSLNILDAVGTYGLNGISSFLWTIGLFGNPGAEYNYESMTISVVPGPGALVSMSLLACFMRPGRRRRGT